MNATFVSRRAALAAFAGAALAPAWARADNSAMAVQVFRAIEVDVQPTREMGSDILADWIAAELPALLRKSLGAHLNPADRNAPLLRARIDSITLGEDHSSGLGIPSQNVTDYIEGAGVVVGAGGRVIASYPLLCSLGASTQAPDPEGIITRQRVDNLAQSFAEWLPGKLGL